MTFVVKDLDKLNFNTLKNTKLIRLIRTFTAAEMNEFGKFVRSPFFNESTKMVKMYNCVKKHFPEFSDTRFTKEKVYSAIYGQSAYDDKKMRDRLFDMQFLADEYLTILNLKKNQVKYKMHTLNEFLTRNLEVHFEKKHREIISLIEKVVFKNEISFYDEYMLHSKKIEFYQSAKPVGKRKNFFEEFSVHVGLFLKYFTAQMLQNFSVFNNIQSVMKHPFENRFYEEVMKYADEMKLDSYPGIKALRLLIRLHTEPGITETYHTLKKLYLEYHSKMSSSDRSMIGTELLIYTRMMTRAGNDDFIKESFEMMKLQIELGTHPLERGYMKRETFLVSVDAALSVDEVEWARSFIRKYSGKVDPKQRDDLILWAGGTMLLYELNYNQALKEFSRIRINDYVYYFWVKVPVARIYYELQEYEKLFMLIDSFKHYVSSNHLIPEYPKAWYSSFFSILCKLTKLAVDFDEHKLLELNREVKNSGFSSNNSWLKKKINDLKKINRV